MRILPPALLAITCLAALTAAAETPEVALCRSNPAFSLEVMRNILDSQLQKDHDPALDAEPPDQMAAEAVEQGVKDCATELQADPALYRVLSALPVGDLQAGWDAYNTACSDRKSSKADCVRAEVGSVRALKRMVATDEPPGAKALVETCELVLQPDPPMAEWRACVDMALTVHAPASVAVHCKTTVPWHMAKSGLAAGKAVSACLQAAHPAQDR